MHLGCSSKAEQILPWNIEQLPDTLQESPVTESTKLSSNSTSPHQSSKSKSAHRSSNSTSPQRSSSEEDTPPSSANPSPPRTPIAQIIQEVSSLTTYDVRARYLTNDDQYGHYDPSDNRHLLLELESEVYPSVLSWSRWNKLRPWLYRDPTLNSHLRGHLERQRAKKSASKQESEKAEEMRKSECSQDEPAEQEGTSQQGTSQQEEQSQQSKSRVEKASGTGFGTQ